MADHRLDDLIETLAHALARTRGRCAREHLHRLQQRWGARGLDVATLVDGHWEQRTLPLADLVKPRGIMAMALEVQIDCRIEELRGTRSQPPGLALCPCSDRADHRLTICLQGGNPMHGQLLLDGQPLRTFSVPLDTGGAA
ncbi:hypothetical protein [Stenotrophomonas sp.]|uniref:hypothetical protein n=1 Tax=Stenotrophomonas sp. TaxID=69392 RepID=UPI0028AA9B85|nr:hypothetical protein [Stenotrophomonas sp.]